MPRAPRGEVRRVAWEHARAYLHLWRNEVLIGANDLWIAAAAIAHDLPLVTRNQRHFERVPGLQVGAYV